MAYALRNAMGVNYDWYLDVIDLDGAPFVSGENSRRFFQHIKRGLPSKFIPPAILKHTDGSKAKD